MSGRGSENRGIVSRVVLELEIATGSLPRVTFYLAGSVGNFCEVVVREQEAFFANPIYLNDSQMWSLFLSHS